MSWGQVTLSDRLDRWTEDFLEVSPCETGFHKLGFRIQAEDNALDPAYRLLIGRIRLVDYKIVITTHRG